MPGEWLAWHQGYDGDTPLAKRLRVVQDLIGDALDAARPGVVRVISICAGDGRDLLGVLAAHPRGDDVKARLVEFESELVAAGQASAARGQLGAVDFRRGDASVTESYSGAVPADLVLACGIFGNIAEGDIQKTIAELPRLCAANGTVIWTRGRFEPDLTPTIRTWFSRAGFSELAFVPIPDSTASVGANRLEREPLPFRRGLRMFTFLESQRRPASNARTDAVPGDPLQGRT
ncbi:MAG TPA: class I SAM-dependent methyltransferase family protein [Candidatus Dormibacteraeota bacterium]